MPIFPHQRPGDPHGENRVGGEIRKTGFRPKEDSWRLGVDARIGMSALEIWNGQYRFYDIDDAPYE